MGAGKTSVGWRLAKKLGWKFIDLDEEIECQEGRAVAEIFLADGEAGFRRIERTCLKKFSSSSNTEKYVIAFGGGTFLDPENRAFAENTGLTVWLKVSFSTVAGRVKIDGTRPKFASKEQAELLHQAREPYYALAKLHISTDQGTPDTVVDEILGAIRES